MYRKIIFLDIDGVLNCAGCFKTHHEEWVAAGKPSVYRWWSMIEPEHVKHLNKIIEETGAEIVISSSWRGDPKTPDILKENGVVANFIGVTPRLGRPAGTSHEYYERGKEIQAWMRENIPRGEAFNYVILEDESDIMPTQLQVKTEWKEGLQEKHADAAIRLLNGETCLNCRGRMSPVKDGTTKTFTGHVWWCQCMPEGMQIMVG